MQMRLRRVRIVPGSAVVARLAGLQRGPIVGRQPIDKALAGCRGSPSAFAAIGMSRCAVNFKWYDCI